MKLSAEQAEKLYMIYFPRPGESPVSVEEVRQTLRPTLQECDEASTLADAVEALTDTELASLLAEWQQDWDREFA